MATMELIVVARTTTATALPPVELIAKIGHIALRATATRAGPRERVAFVAGLTAVLWSWR